jgi:hypothetical protein
MLPWMAGNGPRSSGKLDAGQHGVVADEFHDLGGELLAFYQSRSGCRRGTSGRPNP